MYAQNELLFPHHAIAALCQLRGPQWQSLVERVLGLPECHEETLALLWMMIRLNGCNACETDSFRAMRGCVACAVQTLRRFKGSDDELLNHYQQALVEIRQFAEHNPTYAIQEATHAAVNALRLRLRK